MAIKRLLALDVFRGATMMLMVLVNTPGSWGLYKDVFSPTLGALNGSLVFALCAVTIVGLVLWIFNRKGWFLKI